MIDHDPELETLRRFRVEYRGRSLDYVLTHHGTLEFAIITLDAGNAWVSAFSASPKELVSLARLAERLLIEHMKDAANGE
jgi:hypothetical protein